MSSNLIIHHPYIVKIISECLPHFGVCHDPEQYDRTLSVSGKLVHRFFYMVVVRFVRLGDSIE